MTIDHDGAIAAFAAELFARASDPAQATTDKPTKSNHVHREGTLSDPAPKHDRGVRLFVGELFGLDT